MRPKKYRRSNFWSGWHIGWERTCLAEAKKYIAIRENVDVSEHILLAYVGRSVADFVVEVIAPANSQLIEKAIIDIAAITKFCFVIFIIFFF